MRGIILTRSGNFYLTDTKPDYSKDGKCVSGELIHGGEVSVPLSNVEAVEFYDGYGDAFNRRYSELMDRKRDQK